MRTEGRLFFTNGKIHGRKRTIRLTVSANVPFYTVSTCRLIRGHNGLHTVRRQFFAAVDGLQDGRTGLPYIIINIHSYILIEKAVRLLNLFSILFIDLNQSNCQLVMEQNRVVNARHSNADKRAASVEHQYSGNHR